MPMGVTYKQLSEFADYMNREGISEIPAPVLRSAIAKYFDRGSIPGVDRIMKSLKEFGFLKEGAEIGKLKIIKEEEKRRPDGK